MALPPRVPGAETGGTTPEVQVAGPPRRAGRPVAGIEIGGTKLQLGIGDGHGTLLALERLAVDPSRRAGGILRQIEAAFPRLLEKAGLESGQLRGGSESASAAQFTPKLVAYKSLTR